MARTGPWMSGSSGNTCRCADVDRPDDPRIKSGEGDDGNILKLLQKPSCSDLFGASTSRPRAVPADQSPMALSAKARHLPLATVRHTGQPWPSSRPPVAQVPERERAGVLCPL